jgi:hypothetical protein
LGRIRTAGARISDRFGEYVGVFDDECRGCWQSLRTSSRGGEDLAELGGERLRFPGLTVLTTEEPAVAAWEDDGLDAQTLGDRSASKSGR